MVCWQLHIFSNIEQTMTVQFLLGDSGTKNDDLLAKQAHVPLFPRKDQTFLSLYFLRLVPIVAKNFNSLRFSFLSAWCDKKVTKAYSYEYFSNGQEC